MSGDTCAPYIQSLIKESYNVHIGNTEISKGAQGAPDNYIFLI